MKTTRMYNLNKLPSWVSKPKFEGSENIKIKSREESLENIKNFINRCKFKTDGCNACTILGEWGQGKTEIYNGFIEPFLNQNGDYSFFVSASTLSNIYENEEISKIFSRSSLVASRLLAALFEGIRAESRKNNMKSLPPLADFVEPEDYLDEILESLLSPYDKSKKIFIFIDEFEELLLNNEALKKITSGIKELINGQYGVINNGGTYEASVHLFISITPDARYKLEVSEDTSLIMGGLGRRLEEVELKEIKKDEGINFLKNLLEHIYDNQIPSIYPIESYGLFNTLFRISQRNLGNLVKLFSQLFNVLEKDGSLEVLNYKNLLKFLESSKIYVFGAQTPCIDKDTYYKIIKSLNDQTDEKMGNLTVTIFKQLLGDLKPFNINELAHFADDDSSIYRSINIINSEIKNIENVEKGIIKLCKVNENFKIEDIFDSLKYYIKTDEKIDKDIIEIGNFVETLDDFEDRISSFNTSLDNNLIQTLFLPYDENDIKIFFRDEINNDNAIEIRNLFKRFIEEEIHFAISDLLLDLVYPTPVPRFLEYIQNKEIRLDLWRKITRNLNEEYLNHMPSAFIECLERSDIYNIHISERAGNYSILNFTDNDLETSINTLIYSTNGNVKAEDIEFINNKLNNDLKIHLALIIHTGEFTTSAKEILKNKGLNKEGNNSILNIHLHPTLSKRIISAYKSLNHQEVLDNDRFNLECNEIIKREINVKDKLKEWVYEQSEKGLVINQISTSHLRKFADCLKLYINYLDEYNSSSDILRKNLEDLLKFRMYGSKKGLITTDFEDSPNDVINLSVDLYKNGFLKRNIENDIYKVMDHPVEKRIYNIIQKEKKVTVSELQSYFIVREKNKKVFEDVFLNILEYKGKISKNQKYYTLTDNETSFSALKKEYSAIQKTFSKKAYKEFGHFFISKKKEHKLICINELKRYLDLAISQIENYQFKPGFEDFVASRIHICTKLIQQFNCVNIKGDKCFSKAIEGAEKVAKKIYETDLKSKTEIDRSIESIIESCNKRLNLNLTMGKSSIQEYKKFEEYFKLLENIYHKPLKKDDLESIIQKVDFDDQEFKFDNPVPQAHYFNLKLYEITNVSTNFNEQVELINKLKYKVNVQLDNINSMQAKLENQLKSFPAEKKYKISFYTYNEIISSDLETNESKRQEIDLIKLSDIEKLSKNIFKDIEDRYSAGLELLNFMKKLREVEKELINSINKSKLTSDHAHEIMDTKNLAEIYSNYSLKISRIKEEYYSLDPKELVDIDEDPSLLIERWNQTLNIENIELFTSWKEYVKINKDFIKKIYGMLQIIEKKGEYEEKIELEKFKDMLSSFVENIDNSLNQQKISASQIETYKSKITEKLDEIVIKYLNREELILLDIIQSINKNDWVDYDQILDEARNNGLNEESLEKAFEGLVSKKYLQRGFYLL